MALSTNYYLDEYSDEIVPCDCSLQGWADWLDKADPDWNRDKPASEGEVFAGFSLEVLGDVRVEWRDGEWMAVTPIPEGVESFYKRHHEGGFGWDADFAADTISDATDCLEPDDSPVWYACTRSGPSVLFQFSRTADGPRLSIVPAKKRH